MFLEKVRKKKRNSSTLNKLPKSIVSKTKFYDEKILFFLDLFFYFIITFISDGSHTEIALYIHEKFP